MAEYLIQDSTLTSIGNEIRTLRGSSSKMTPATMTSNLKSANTEVNNQTTIMNQILATLEAQSDGNNGLNFKIIDGTTQPSNPEENTIWINTSVPISSWEFSATQPVSSTSKVWICTGTSSNVEFNMSMDNTVKIYPIYAKQYISGTWTDVSAKSYIAGQWVDWWIWQGELYDNGNQYEVVTGGWVRSTSSSSNTAIIDTNSLTVSAYGSGSAYIMTNKIIPLAKFNRLKVNVIGWSSGDNSNNRCQIMILDSNKNQVVIQNVASSKEYTIDVSSLDVGYIQLYAYACESCTHKMIVNKIFLE